MHLTVLEKVVIGYHLLVSFEIWKVLQDQVQHFIDAPMGMNCGLKYPHPPSHPSQKDTRPSHIQKRSNSIKNKRHLLVEIFHNLEKVLRSKLV